MTDVSDQTTLGPFQLPRRRTATTGLVLVLCLIPAAVDPFPTPPDSVVPCVPCHSQQGNQQVGEWLASPYSQTEGGRGCIDCHGRRCAGTHDGNARNGRPAATAPRGPAAAARLTVTAVCTSDGVEVEVVVANLGTGHDLPTGSPERILVLEVSARREDGVPLAQRPAGAPGRIFVKHLPTGNSEAYRLRLAPFETDVSRYRFVSAGRHSARVTARLALSPASGNSYEIARTTTMCRAPGAAP